MKIEFKIPKLIFIYILTGCILLLNASCSKWLVPETMTGKWSGKEIVTVRMKVDGKFVFISSKDSMDINLLIQKDNGVTGNIGNAILTDGIVSKNRGEVGRKIGIKTDYIITGNLKNTIFEEDTIELKPISMPFNIVNNCFEGSIFQHTGNLGLFPMFDLNVCKID